MEIENIKKPRIYKNKLYVISFFTGKSAANGAIHSINHAELQTERVFATNIGTAKKELRLKYGFVVVMEYVKFNLMPHYINYLSRGEQARFRMMLEPGYELESVLPELIKFTNDAAAEIISIEEIILEIPHAVTLQ